MATEAVGAHRRVFQEIPDKAVPLPAIEALSHRKRTPCLPGLSAVGNVLTEKATRPSWLGSNAKGPYGHPGCRSETRPQRKIDA